MIFRFKRRDSFSIERAPGVQFYFNAEDVSGTSANTWNDRTGTCRAEFTSNGVTPYNLQFNNTPTSGGVKCAYFQNDGFCHVVRTSGADVYEVNTPFPTDWWAVVVVSPTGSSGAGRSFFSTNGPVEGSNRFFNFSYFCGFNFGLSRFEWNLATRVSNGGSWHDIQNNAINPNGAPPNFHFVNTYRPKVLFLQGGSQGMTRINGVAYNFQNYSPDAKIYAPTGSPSIGIGCRFSIGCIRSVANSIMTGGVRAAAYGEGALSVGDIERIEGILAHDAAIQSDLPADHPYKLTPP